MSPAAPVGVERFDRSLYNGLPSLEEATASVRLVQPAFAAFMTDASRALAQTKLHDGEVSAFLLHRHWSVRDDHVLLERPLALSDGRTGMRTAAAKISVAVALKATPNRWAAGRQRSGLVPLEFSTDPIVADIGARLIAVQRLMVDLLRRHRLEKLLGFAVVPRLPYRASPVTDYVETNERGTSIVTPEHLSADDRRTAIITGWSLSRPSPLRRAGSVQACCYCVHGPLGSCKHPKPDPPVCSPHGCVKPTPSLRTLLKPTQSATIPVKRIRGAADASPRRPS